MAVGDIDWEELVRHLGPSLQKYFRAGFPQAVADDLVQDTLIRLVRKCTQGQYDPSRGTLRMYAFGLAHFVRLEALKSNTRLKYVAHYWDSDLVSEERPAEQNLMQQKLRQAISQLSPIQQQIVLLTIDQQLQLTEIAKILELALGTVKSHVHRAKLALKQILKDDGGKNARSGVGPTIVSPQSSSMQ